MQEQKENAVSHLGASTEKRPLSVTRGKRSNLNRQKQGVKRRSEEEKKEQVAGGGKMAACILERNEKKGTVGGG